MWRQVIVGGKVNNDRDDLVPKAVKEEKKRKKKMAGWGPDTGLRNFASNSLKLNLCRDCF